MTHSLKLAIMGFLVAGLPLRSSAEILKLTSSPYPEEQLKIDYNYIFNPGGDWSGTFGPHYSLYDLAARNEPPSATVNLLENHYQALIKQGTKPVTADNIVMFLIPAVGQHGDLKLTPTKLIYSGKFGIGGIFHGKEYAGNLLATAAAHGRLDVLKAIVDWVKQKLQQHGALDKLSVVLSAPAINFGVKTTKGCLILGTALVFALLNEEYAIVQYLLDQGALPEGALVAKGSLSPEGDKKIAQISCPVNGIVFDPEDILIAKRILDAQAAGKLNLDQKLEASLKKSEADRISEKRRQEKEQFDREKKEKIEAENLARYLEEQKALDKTHKLETLNRALKESRAQLEADRRGKELLRDAAKAVFKYPEFFEKVLKERPDLADIIEDGAIRFAGAFDNYEQTPATKMAERAAEMRNRLAEIRKQVGAQEKPIVVMPLQK